MVGVFERFDLKVGEKKQNNNAIISAYEFKNANDPLFNLRAMRDGGSLFTIEDGKYIRLNLNGSIWMSDTKMEKRSNMEFVSKAKGRVFIAGLGIGLIIHNLKDKVDRGIITEIVVMENSQEIIDLVSPYYTDMPITYILDDVLKYQPPKNEKYDTIYFDIWVEIDSDNLKEIAMLHNRWKFRKNKGGWMDSWMKNKLQQMKRKEYNYGW